MNENPENKAVLYRFGSFEMNAKEGILRRQGKIVPLTPKIFETLLLLVRNNGRILTKDEIMETVWADSFVEETNLTSNISRLRKILDANGDAQHIETFSKRGYRFRAEVEEIRGDSEILVTRRTVTRIRQTVEETDETEIAPEYAAYLNAVPNNLHAPPNALVGREKEIAEICSLLRQNRLVTLTGIGGTGKTRLTQEIALRMLPEFADGVFFVALEAVRDAELIASEFAQIPGVKKSVGKSLIEKLKNFLQAKQMLIAADNFEQIISAAPFLIELLNAAPNLRILVTSRVRLHLKPEREFIVPPLALPAANRRTPLGELSNYVAVNLFERRAQSAKQNFLLTEENAETTTEICRKLDGLPLAIELAAARIKILSPRQILTRLENRLKLLTGGANYSPARQQTMRGAIEWSYDLLVENERILFRRLAVFAGGFTIEAAEAVCDNYELRIANHESIENRKLKTEDKKPNPEIDVLNGIASLLENSLLVQAETKEGESRFRFLEVVREYALETLETSVEDEILKKNHAVFFLALANEAEPEFFGEHSAEWLNRLEEEHDNLRAALVWSFAQDAQIAANLAGSLRNFWILHNHLAEGRGWLEKAVTLNHTAPQDIYFKLLNGLGHTAGYQGDLETARKAHEEGLKAGAAINDLRQIALSYRGLGFAAKWRGDIADARKFIEKGLMCSRQINEKNGIAVSLNALGDLARVEEDYAAARPLFEESLSICRQIGNTQGVAGSLNNLGAVTFGEGDYAAACAYYDEALSTVRRLGEKISLSYSLDGFAALAVKRGDAQRAAQLAGAAEQLRSSLGFEIEPAERRFRDTYFAELRSASDEKILAENYRQGLEMTIEKVVETALEFIKSMR